MKFRVNADVYFAMTVEEVIDADSEQAAEEQLEQKIRETAIANISDQCANCSPFIDKLRLDEVEVFDVRREILNSELT